MRVFLLVLALLSSCTTVKEVYTETCHNMMDSQFQRMADATSLACVCPQEKMRVKFQQIPDSVCLKKEMQSPNEADGSAMGQMACSLGKEAVFSFIGNWGSAELDCEIPLNSCLTTEVLSNMVDQYVCSNL